MKRGNVEFIRRQFELWSRGDFDEWAADYHDDVVVVAPSGWPEGTVSEGLEAWRRQAERLRETWARAEVAIDEIETVGEDRVVARIRYVTRGTDEAMSFETPMAVAFFLDDGRIRRAEYYWEMSDARSAAERAP